MNRIFYLLGLSLLCGTAFAVQMAVTEDGRTVRLNDDGTWEYVKEVAPDVFDFRKAIWGMTEEEVTKGERLKLVHDADGVKGYEGEILGLDCYVVYIFVDNKLVRTKYSINEKLPEIGRNWPVSGCLGTK